MADPPSIPLPGVSLTRQQPRQILSLVGRRGAEAELAAKVFRCLGVMPPDGPRRSQSGAVNILGVGPRRWLVVSDDPTSGIEGNLAAELANVAQVCVQSDAYSVFRVAGPNARQALAKGVPIDLHASAFGNTDAAVTAAAHVGVILWQVDEMPTYDLAVFRSYERGFWAWLCDCAAEFGFTQIERGAT